MLGPIRPVGIGADPRPVSMSDAAANSVPEQTGDDIAPAGAEKMPAEYFLRVLSQAEGLLRLGRPDAAAALARRLPTTGPHGFAALKVRAWALLRSGGYAELADLLADENPLAGELLFLRGTGRVRGGEVSSGGRDLKQLWWEEPDGVWGLAALRELAEVTGIYTKREQQVIRRQIGRLTSTTDDPAAPGGETATLLDALIRNVPPRTRLDAELHRAKGIRLTRAEDYAGAVAVLSQAMARTRDQELRRAIELRLGEAERRSGHLRAAARCFDHVAATGDDALALEGFASAGQMYIEYRRYQQARRRFESQLVTNPVGPGRRQALWGLGWVAYRTGDFAGARRFFQTLHDEEPFGDQAPGAIYWAARASEEMGGTETAVRAELAALVERFPVDYYAYRASERLGPKPWPSTAGALPREQLTPAAKHVTALLGLGMQRRVRKELQRVLETDYRLMGPETMTRMAEAAVALDAPGIAANLIQRRNRRFPDGTVATTGVLAKQLPDIYVSLVSKEALGQRVNPHLAVALVRQESGFNPNATSPVGALGLMQLMPETARDLVREINRRARPTRAQILDPQRNVRLGVRYLGRMLRGFGNRAELALAAYNAGPGAVTRWRQARGDLPADIFVEEIPYRETDQYVRRVLGWVQAIRMIEGAGRRPAEDRTVLAAREL